MSLLPFVNQFILPTFISVYAVIAALLPYTGAHPIVRKASHIVEKKVAAAQITPTPTPKEIQTTVTHNDTHNKENSGFTSEKADQKETSSSSPTPTPIQSGLTPEENTDPSSATDTTPIPSNTGITPAVVATTISAQTTIAASGKTLHLFMHYPSLGGAITGTISGDCTGTISGTYDGPSKQTLSGKGNTTCPLGIVNIPVEIHYTGKLTSTTNATITYTVTALGKTQTGNTNLNL